MQSRENVDGGVTTVEAQALVNCLADLKKSGTQRTKLVRHLNILNSYPALEDFSHRSGAPTTGLLSMVVECIALLLLGPLEANPPVLFSLASRIYIEMLHFAPIEEGTIFHQDN